MHFNCWHHINSTNQTRYIQEDYMLYRSKFLIDGARQRARKAGLEFSLSLEWLETQDLQLGALFLNVHSLGKRQNTNNFYRQRTHRYHSVTLHRSH